MPSIHCVVVAIPVNTDQRLHHSPNKPEKERKTLQTMNRGNHVADVLLLRFLSIYSSLPQRTETSAMKIRSDEVSFFILIWMKSPIDPVGVRIVSRHPLAVVVTNIERRRENAAILEIHK